MKTINKTWPKILIICVSFVFLLFFLKVTLNFFNILDQNQETKNAYGWMDNPLDPISIEFINDTKMKANPVVFEIGAGTGLASLEALKNGATVWVNDLEAKHLNLFAEKVPAKFAKNYKLVPGDFPDALTLPKDTFDNILAIRVLHFFDPQKLEKAIQSMYASLKPGGKVYILVASPFHPAWPSFVPEYESRIKKGDPFPGYTEHFSKYNSGYKEEVPEKVHFLDPLVLRREFEKAGFIIKFDNFVDGIEPIPNGPAKDKSMVGLIAEKP